MPTWRKISTSSTWCYVLAQIFFNLNRQLACSAGHQKVIAAIYSYKSTFCHNCRLYYEEINSYQNSLHFIWVSSCSHCLPFWWGNNTWNARKYYELAPTCNTEVAQWKFIQTQTGKRFSPHRECSLFQSLLISQCAGHSWIMSGDKKYEVMLYRYMILVRYTDIVPEGKWKGRNCTCLRGGELGKEILLAISL